MHCYLLISFLFFSFAKTKQIILIEYGTFIEGTSSAIIGNEIIYQVNLNPDNSLYRISYETTSQFNDLLFVWENVTENFSFEPNFRIRSPCSILVNPSNQIRIVSQISFSIDFRFLIQELEPLLNENEIVFSQSCCNR